MGRGHGSDGGQVSPSGSAPLQHSDRFAKLLSVRGTGVGRFSHSIFKPFADDSASLCAAGVCTDCDLFVWNGREVTNCR